MKRLAELREQVRQSGDGAPLVAEIPYARFLGVELRLVAGQPRARLPARESLVGNARLPALHGGVTAAFMENAALLHLMVGLDELRVPKSIDFAIDYLRSARLLDLWAVCEVSRAGSRVAQVLIRAWQCADAPVDALWDSPGFPPAGAVEVAFARAHFLLDSGEG